MDKRFELNSTNTAVYTWHGHWQNLHVGCTQEAYDRYPENFGSFTTKEEALRDLATTETVIRYDSNRKCYDVTEYYVEEVNYDEDGEWESSDGIWEFSRMPLKYDYERLAGTRWCDLSEREKEELTSNARLDTYSEDETEEIEIGYHLYITGIVRVKEDERYLHGLYTLEVEPDTTIYAE